MAFWSFPSFVAKFYTMSHLSAALFIAYDTKTRTKLRTLFMLKIYKPTDISLSLAILVINEPLFLASLIINEPVLTSLLILSP